MHTKITQFTAISLIASAVLTGCSEKEVKQIQVEVPEKIAPKVVEVPEGRWLANNEHCENTLDISRISDFTLRQEGIEKTNIFIRGVWEEVEKGSYERLVKAAATTMGKCLNINENTLHYSRLITGAESAVFAFDEKRSIAFRINEKSKVTLLMPFEVEKLGQYQVKISYEDEESASNELKPSLAN